MGRVFTRKAVVLGILAGITGAVAVLAACSSGSSTPAAFNNNEGGTTTQGCTNNNALEILFSPMYSAYEGMHSYQVPAVVNGIDNSIVMWSVSDSTIASFATDTDTGGIMLTMKNSGTVTVSAQAGGLCGTSTLNITAAQASDWATGSARYNSGVPFYPGCVGLGHRVPEGGCPDAGPGCTNCHGATGNTSVFNDIAHTPEQTGGFSDQELIGIFQGTVPDGGYFDPSIIDYPTWQSFHHWTDIQGNDQQAMVVYLRSLTPTSQGGSVNFGGHYDGGGGHHHDGGGGGGGGNDSGTTAADGGGD